jgi:glycosyltransferase involved in cell wall biosynthesis
MKITIIVGGRFHAFDLAYQLQNKKINFKLITSYPKFIVKKFHLFTRNIDTIFIKELLKRFFDRIPFLNKIFDYNYWINNFFSLRASKLVNYRNTDILIGWSGFSYYSFEKAKKFNCIKVLERGSSHILYQSKILKEEYNRLNLATYLPSKKTIETELKEYELADYICVPSEFARKTFIEKGFSKKKIIKIPYGVDIKNFYPNFNKDKSFDNNKKFTIISTGSISVRKGSIYLLRAFKELNLLNAELIFVGSIDNDLKVILSKYSSMKNIKFYNKQPQSKLKEFYNKADVFVLFSVEEGLSMVQIQAMACGLPVICTYNTGGSEIVDNGINGFVLPIRNMKLLKKKILLLYNSPDLLKKMKRKAYNKAKNFMSWDIYGQKMVTFYNKII